MLVMRNEAAQDLWNQINRPEYGEKYVYRADPGDSCVYVRDGEPSCLIGQYLINVLHVPVDYFEEDMDLMVGRKNIQEFADLVDDLHERFEIQFEPGLARDLREIQAYQDDGVYWGAAYNAVFGDGTDPHDNADDNDRNNYF